MQFHIFTAIFTCVVFVYLRYNKEQYKGDYSMYAIIVPILLYSYTYFSENKSTNIKSIGTASVVEPTLMTETYPMSSSN